MLKMTANYPKHRPDLFWLVVGLITLTAFLTSCVTEKACSKYWKDSVKDSVWVHDTTIVRDTIVKIDERTITIRDTVPCDDFELSKDSGGVKVQVLVKDKIIYVKASCAAIELKLKLYDKITRINRTRELTRVVTLRSKSKFQVFKDYWFYISASLIVLCILRFVLKTYTKLQIPF